MVMHLVCQVLKTFACNASAVFLANQESIVLTDLVLGFLVIEREFEALQVSLQGAAHHLGPGDAVLGVVQAQAQRLLVLLQSRLVRFLLRQLLLQSRQQDNINLLFQMKIYFLSNPTREAT